MTLTMFILVLLATYAACLLAQTTSDGLPRFVVEPQDAVEQTGATVRLECQVSSLSGNQVVAWMKEATFQTSGRSVLTKDPDKLSRITVEDSTSERDLHFNLFIHNVRSEDAGVYYCYVVEFWELNQRRWTRSRPARLTVVDVTKPSVRCLQPSEEELTRAAGLGESVAVGCTVLSNQPGMAVKIQTSDGTVLLENNQTDDSDYYEIRSLLDTATLREEKLTCLIVFKDEASSSGEATRSCSMGPFIAVPPALNRSRITVDLVPGSDGHLSCPAHGDPRLGAATQEKPLWALEPRLPAHRYSLSPDGLKITLLRVTPQDNGLLVSCSVPSTEGGHRTVDMEVRVRTGDGQGGSRPDLHGQQVQDGGGGGGSRDRVAPKPVIGQPAWSVLRGRVSSGLVKPAPSPGHVVDTVIHRGVVDAGNLPDPTLTPTTPEDQISNIQDADNDTSTTSLPSESNVSLSTVPSVTDQPSLSLSPLIIVALCEAGMSLLILIIAFAVLCQCCCRNQAKGKVQGDKDLSLATASFGKQSTTPTLLTYKSTAVGRSNPDLSQKKLPPIPKPKEGDVFARTEDAASAKKVLRASDLPPPGSWVFSSVNSESGEAETETPATGGEPGNEIYVTMV